MNCRPEGWTRVQQKQTALPLIILVRFCMNYVLRDAPDGNYRFEIKIIQLGQYLLSSGAERRNLNFLSPPDKQESNEILVK
jgi:hypothetical protein